MASTGITQKQRLEQWEAWRRWGLHNVPTSIERKSSYGFELEKTTDDGEDNPGASGEGEARAEAGEERGQEAGSS
jgi:hypothetical protein